MITYSKDQLLLIKHSSTLLTRRADEENISILRENSCPITQLKRQNRRQRGWMAGLRRVASDDIAKRPGVQCSEYLQQIGRPQQSGEIQNEQKRVCRRSHGNVAKC